MRETESSHYKRSLTNRCRSWKSSRYSRLDGAFKNVDAVKGSIRSAKRSFQLRNRHSADQASAILSAKDLKISWNLNKPADNGWHSSENRTALSSSVKK